MKGTVGGCDVRPVLAVGDFLKARGLLSDRRGPSESTPRPAGLTGLSIEHPGCRPC
jgi:hypothetical protein